jgi:hypothetical protein
MGLQNGFIMGLQWVSHPVVIKLANVFEIVGKDRW